MRKPGYGHPWYISSFEPMQNLRAKGFFFPSNTTYDGHIRPKHVAVFQLRIQVVVFDGQKDVSIILVYSIGTVGCPPLNLCRMADAHSGIKAQTYTQLTTG